MSLLAISDLHVRYAENRAVVDGLRPGAVEDWLVVAGDVGELSTDVVATMALLRERFAQVVWVPGNHDLWTLSADPLRLRGRERYEHLVEELRAVGVLTPEDPYPLWPGPHGPVVVAPLFLLYDYTFRPAGTATKEEALAVARRARVVCTDEGVLHPHPYATREDWCAARLESTRARLDALDPALPTVLVNHWPLVREPTAVLRHPEFALWCGTTGSADWPVRYRAAAVVYGHLHVPRTTEHDGVPHHEVSLGYPREWGVRTWGPPLGLRLVLPSEPEG
ncbi:metallophosphoesterase [Kineococcus gypseus]|uniref:metallophosphoesterase family protein n=1 Tax=Kineococcus gypseus TaxID=1637102 RepID=UPI003D7EA6FB